MKRNPIFSLSVRALPLACALTFTHISFAAAPGPVVTVPDGGQPPGAYPNTSVSSANWIARGGPAYDGNVEMNLAENGPIPWSITRYNRGDFAIRISPRDPVAARANLNQGFTEVLNASAAEAPGQAWTPHRNRGVLLVTARQNGPITWPDGEPAFFPTVAASTGSSGNGYDMITGLFDTGDSDVNTGKAGPANEGNFNFVTTWFPFDQGWIGADVAGPTAEGASAWTEPNAHAVGITPSMVKWLDYPASTAAFGGHAQVRLPKVNTLEDGMLFAISTDGASDVNIVGVAPAEDGEHWLVTIREDSETNPEALAAAGQSEFQFVYIPFDSQNLIGGHIVGDTGATRKGAGQFTLARTAAGTYELTIPGKTAANGALILQVADLEAGTPEPLASRAFLSYEFANGKFTIQSRKTSDSGADLADASFYFAWVDFSTPLAPPAVPTMRSTGPQIVSDPAQTAAETAIAASSHAPEILVTYIDTVNGLGYNDPITGQTAAFILVGRFHNARTLAPISEPFPILGNPNGQITKNDVEYNPITREYIVVASGRAYTAGGFHVPLIAIVKPPVGDTPPSIVKAWAHDPDTTANYDDVTLAVSTANGNFLLVAERNFAGEGEGTIGTLYNSAGTLITPEFTRLDLLQQIGDEDDPDVIYLPELDAFLYISNTDNSNGSTGTLSNRIVGSVVDETPGPGGTLVVRTEAPIGDGLPAGRAEGHPATIENPFNGQLITAYDAGNGTSFGDLAFTTIGPAPTYPLTTARAEVPYLAGPAAGDPFTHQHPQFAVDPTHGVFVLGFNAAASTVNLPNGYAFHILGPDGLPLASQLGAPYYLAETAGAINNGVNYHNIVYSPATGTFVAAYSADATAQIAGLEITSTHITGGDPELTVTLNGSTLTITWPASATGYELQSATSILGPWGPSGLTVTTVGNLNQAQTTTTDNQRYFRLRKP